MLLKLSLNKKVLAVAILAALPALVQAEEATRAQWLMGTVCEITAHGPGAAEAVAAAFSEIRRWDRVLSLYKADSELSRLNRAPAGRDFPCSPSLWEAMDSALSVARQSEGAFDPTILPALRRGKAGVDLVGYAKVSVDPASRSVKMAKAGMGLDFGGIGKGIALDHVADIMRRRGVSGLINFGGQLCAVGSAPGRDGWIVKIAFLGRSVILKDASASISADDQQPGHIASPFTGRRLFGRRAVAVIMPSAAQADAWSTALYVRDGVVPKVFHGCVLRRPSDLEDPACAPYARPGKVSVY